MKRFVLRRLVTVLSVSGILGAAQLAQASGFQLWEQDGASIGNYHAGYAALATDASIAFYNPAGLTRFKNQQVVVATDAILTSFKYQGGMTVSTINAGNDVLPVTAQGGVFNLVPALHYAAPINDRLAFGFSVDVPFGLKTNYGKNTPLQYAATMSSVMVIDVSPVLAFRVTDKASVGLGPDIQRMYGEFDQTGTLGGMFNTPSVNKANDTAYGYHAGFMYEFTPETRMGLSYHSQVVHHLSGTSRFQGELADLFNNGPIVSSRATVNVTLPAYTALSVYSRIRPQVAVMGSAIYTQWSSFQNLIFNNVAGLDPDPSTHIQVNIPEHYRNTWNFSFGADYYATDQITLRGGIGYDETPVRNAYRHVQLPDNNRYIIALGSHYQASRAIGLDLSWQHLFMNQARINPPPQAAGVQVVTTNGNVNGGADVFGAQLTWDIV